MGRKTSEKCLLCEDLATKTHIVPRSLALELRGDQKHLVAGSANKDGTEYWQNGLWDYMLCEKHEAALGDADSYGTNFCRAAKRLRLACQGDQFTVPNANPELLLRFALSVIWRHVHSPRGKLSGQSLGPFEACVRSSVFEGVPAKFQLGLSTASHSIDNEAVELIDLPRRVRLAGLNAWQFTTTTITFITIISNRMLGSEFESVLASQNDPAIVPVMDLIDLRKGGQAILDRMSRPKPVRE